MRPASLRWTWCNGTSCSPVAAYSLTGTLTRPKATAPFQMARTSHLLARPARRCTRRAGMSVSGQDGPVQPMLATRATGRADLPSGPDWVYEVKWDGVRVLADTTRDSLHLLSRTGRDVTVAYPELGGLAAIKGGVLDGEIVAMAA